jgi:hypothetical protein
MVGNGFQVDMGQLSTLINTLEDAKDAMTNADNALQNASAQDLGSARLDSAGSAFRDKWTYGIGKLSDLADKMTEGLQNTQKTYASCETAIEDAFNKAGAGVAAGSAVADGASQISQRLSGGAS